MALPVMRLHPRLRRFASAALLVVAVGAVAAPAGAQEPEVPRVPDQAHISPDLAGVRVEGTAAATAQAAYDEVAARLGAAVTARTTAEAELAALAAREVELTGLIAAETTNRKAAGLEVAAARQAVEEAAVSSYVVSTTYDDLSRAIDVDSSVEVGMVQTYTEASREDRQAAERAARVELARASRALDDAQLERISVRARTVEVTTAREQAATDEATFTADLAVKAVERDAARATSRVSGVDFSLVALDTYTRAAAGQQACGIEWWVLAGISRTEGRHGTYGGAHLEADGDVSHPIIGIPLTGSNGTAAVGDSDGGALDGDSAYDRAVGPMQFIPQTWARWGRDGDGDGDRDPQNLYDATAAAAAYLCNGRDLTSEAGIRAGYFSYNHSVAYVDAVLAHAYGYRQLVIPPPSA
jgi:membrane-bound lytic murein transglycosylase B